MSFNVWGKEGGGGRVWDIQSYPLPDWPMYKTFNKKSITCTVEVTTFWTKSSKEPFSLTFPTSQMYTFCTPSHTNRNVKKYTAIIWPDFRCFYKIFEENKKVSTVRTRKLW